MRSRISGNRKRFFYQPRKTTFKENMKIKETASKSYSPAPAGSHIATSKVDDRRASSQLGKTRPVDQLNGIAQFGAMPDGLSMRANRNDLPEAGLFDSRLIGLEL